MTSTIVHHDIDWCHLDFSDMPDEFDFLEVATECAEHTYQHNAALYARLRIIDNHRARKSNRKSQAKYRRKYPEMIKARSGRQRIRRNSQNDYVKSDVELARRSQKNKCWHCGCELGSNYHVDHLVPLMRGGSNEPRNIVVTCPKCNISKSDKMCYEWNGKLF